MTTLALVAAYFAAGFAVMIALISRSEEARAEVRDVVASDELTMRAAFGVVFLLAVAIWPLWLTITVVGLLLSRFASWVAARIGDDVEEGGTR